MKIEDFALVLRRRRPWEALDLGQVMARRWRRPLLKAWLATYGPFGVLCACVALWKPGMGLFFLWWSKPVFDRTLLGIYSRAVFGELPSLRQSLSETLRSLKSGQTWLDLTLRRLSPARSFALPVTLLEGQRGAARSARLAVLLRSAGGCATWLTWWGSTFGTLIVITELFVITQLMPAGVLTAILPADARLLFTLSPLQTFALVALVLVADTLIEPWYVAAGFALYLNCRSELEGWDLELVFRRMSERLAAAAPDAAVLPALPAVLMILIALGCVAVPRPGLAEEPGHGPHTFERVPDEAAPPAAPAHPPVVPEDVAAALDRADAQAEDVLADPVFGKPGKEPQWVPHDPAPTEVPTGTPAWLKFIFGLARGLAFLGEWTLRILLGCLLVLIVVYLLVKSGKIPWASRMNAVPDFVMGMDVRAESLPDDIAAAARLLAARGDTVGALALLYRGALSALVHRTEVRFKDGDTEERCLARTRDHIPRPSQDYFGALIRAWQAVAYGHRALPEDELDRLCRAWPERFGPGALTTEAAA